MKISDALNSPRFYKSIETVALITLGSAVIIGVACGAIALTCHLAIPKIWEKIGDINRQIRCVWGPSREILIQQRTFLLKCIAKATKIGWVTFGIALPAIPIGLSGALVYHVARVRREKVQEQIKNKHSLDSYSY